jgi:hypothetical protein
MSTWQAIRATRAEGQAKEERDAAATAEKEAAQQRNEARDANVRMRRRAVTCAEDMAGFPPECGKIPQDSPSQSCSARDLGRCPGVAPGCFTFPR